MFPSPAIIESAHSAAPWAVYLGFLVSAGIPSFVRQWPRILRDTLVFLLFGILSGFGLRPEGGWNQPYLFAMLLAGAGMLVLWFRGPRNRISPPDPSDRRLWTWVLAGAWPVLMGLVAILELLQADLRRAEARASEVASLIARSALQTFERTLPEGSPDFSSPGIPLAVFIDEWKATGATRFEAPEWWLSGDSAFRGRWEKAAAVPFTEAANPWRAIATGIGGEGSAVARFFEVRHGSRQGAVADPVSALDQIRMESPNVRTPSGIPIAVLAWREMFRLPKPADTRIGSALQGSFLEDVRQRPAIWWPSFREALEAGWSVDDTEWSRVVEMLRRLENDTPWRQAVARILERSPGSDRLWVHGPGGRRLLQLRDRPWNNPATAFGLGQQARFGSLYAEESIQAALHAAAGLPAFRSGSGFGIRFRLAGEVLSGVGTPDTSTWKALSEASPLIPSPGDGLRVEVGLADPASYFASVRRQTAWSAGFGISTAAALLVAITLGRRSYLKLQDLTEAQTNFVAGVTHELRAPLASVRLLAENLQRGADTSAERRQEYYGLMVRECRRLGTLVQNVLDWSRIERGRRSYEPRCCDLPALVAETAQVLQPQFDQRCVRLILRLPKPAADPDAWEAMIDPDALQQALVNLLDNALKHSPSDSEVVVSLERDTLEWTLTVTDSGPGIPETEQERIFDQFHRLGSELQRETEGIGIGLSIVRHIVEGHDGRIRVASRPGQGASFVATFPAEPRDPATGETP